MVDAVVELLRAYLHGFACEFRYVVALEQQHVVFWVALRQGKRLVGLTVLVEVCDEGACVVLVHAAAAEGYPASVAAPGVEAVGVWAVGGGQWSWETIPGVHATSSYYHGSVTHSASAQVGTSAVSRDVKGAGGTAQASKTGVGTTRVWWNNEA